MRLVLLRRRRWSTVVVVPLFIALVLQGSAVDDAVAQEKSSCLTCHTSIKDLVKITRALDAKKPPKSTEISGEG